MRNLLLIILTIVANLSYAQSNYTQTDAPVYQYTGWKVENPDDWGSFFWLTTVTQTPDNSGLYYYYVYLYSNSLMSTQTKGEYDKASTYIKDLNVIMYEKNQMGVTYNTVEVYLPYATCDYGDNYYVAWFYSYSNKNTFKLTYSKVSAFDYSIY